VLSESNLVTTVAVTDLERAKRFFSEQLALPILDETPFAIRFGAGKGTQISVRRGQPNVDQTVGHFEVDDIEAVIRDLRSRGVTFEDYEMPKTVGGIAQDSSARAAWSRIRTATSSDCARDRFCRDPRRRVLPLPPRRR
jgi:catechol 2,3-dioxygenase-like lactoylglutathione lyase family enzyme